MIGLQPQLQTVPAGQQLGQRAGFGPGFAVGAVDPGNQSFQLGDAVLIFLHQGGRVLGGLFPFLDGCVVAQTAGKLADPLYEASMLSQVSWQSPPSVFSSIAKAGRPVKVLARMEARGIGGRIHPIICF